MPAAAIKGIIISISIITALGVAVLENPQIQAWLEQQRQNVIELLRNLNEELDPQSRRTAEAFAFEGRTVANDPGLRREASGSLEAAAVATGRSLSNPSTIRRIPVHGPSDPDQVEERKKKGREYLAQRNQQMFELKQRKKTVKIDVEDAADVKPSTPTSPTSFDEMVDRDGKLRVSEPEQAAGKGKEKLLPDTPLQLPDVPEDIKAEMAQVSRESTQPIAVAGPSASPSAWDFGALLANPFTDEHALDRSETPKPPVPPKVTFAIPDDPPISTLPGSFTPRRLEPGPEPEPEHGNNDELSYEEQLAIALSLSEAEAAKAASRAVERMGQSEEEDPDLRAAIEASLQQMAASPSLQPLSARSSGMTKSPFVDSSAPSPVVPLPQSAPRAQWETLFDQSYSPNREPLSLASPASASEEEDELYRVTPQLTAARLASLEPRRPSPPRSSFHQRYDFGQQLADALQTRAEAAQPTAMEASFYSAASSVRSLTTTHTMGHDQEPHLIDLSEGAHDRAATVSRPSTGLRNEFQSDSDSETFASVSPVAISRAHSRPRSEVSNVEVVDVVDDSDVDMLSEVGDGIATPDSWTEVGSRDGESEMDEEDEDRRGQSVNAV